MSDARDQILARLRSTEPATDVPLSRPVARRDWEGAERVARFTEFMRRVRAEVHRADREGWARDLLAWARGRRLENLLYAPETPQGRTLAAARSDADPRLVPYAEPVEQWRDALFGEVQAAVTGSRGGIAETGSLILWPDAHEPRLMSLVPPVHIVLLEASHIYSTFAEAVAEQAWVEDMPSNALLISGPSKSADIEQTLAYGVHGPKELIVLILE
jgi:L-lactate dehydrogenase complex protein LldG